MLGLTDVLTLGLPLVLTPSVLGLAVLGSLVGIIVGALPGLTAVMAVAIMIPLTYTMSPQEAFALLLTAYSGAVFGGSLGAILLNIPGTGAAIMTTFDGYPMRCRGEAGRAIGLAVTSSFVGGVASAFFLAFAAPIIALWALRWGAHEYFAVAFFGLGVIAYISPSILKGLIAGAFGLLISTVGTDPQSAYPRFTFGQADLMSGLQFVPVMIGLFGLGEIFIAIENGITLARIEKFKQKIRGLIPELPVLLRLIPTSLRSIIVGTIIGVIPASGPTIASVVSYGLEKRVGKRREEMGTGVPEGIASAEVANNAATGAAIVPLITMGIPGDSTTAVLLGAFLLHGLRPGPSLFIDRPEIISSILILFMLGNIFFFLFGLLGMRLFVLVLQTPQKILLPAVMALCVIGSYAVQNSPFDILILIVFGCLGYLMRKLEMPVAPTILGFVLGPIVEDNLRRALILSDGNALDFFTRPVSATLILLTILLLVSPYVLGLFTGKKIKVEE
jgi:putative tricarboxylic transport membrane protein